MEQQQSCQREKSSSADQNYQKKCLTQPDQIDTVHVIIIYTKIGKKAF